MLPEASSQVAPETEPVVEPPEPASLEDPSKIVGFKVGAAKASIREGPSISELNSAGDSLLHVLDLCTAPAEMMQQHNFQQAKAHIMRPRVRFTNTKPEVLDIGDEPLNFQFAVVDAIKELGEKSKEKSIHELSLDMELQELETKLDWKLRYLRFVKDIMLGTMVLGIVFLTASLVLEASWRSI